MSAPTEAFEAGFRCGLKSQPSYLGTGCFVYTLLLEGSHFYVGQTNDLSRRLFQHFERGANAAAWTRLFKPVQLISLREGGLEEEREETLKLMRVHGWQRVRGGPWTAVDLQRCPRALEMREEQEEEEEEEEDKRGAKKRRVVEDPCSAEWLPSSESESELELEDEEEN